MRKRGLANIMKFILILVIVVSVLHTSLHIVIYGTGINNFHKSGISGFTIGKLTIGEETKNQYPEIQKDSRLGIIIEWVVIVLMGAFVFGRSRVSKMKDLSSLEIKDKYKRSSTTTDLDVLYEILKDKKKIRVSSISKLFKVETETATEWCKILEGGNLAALDYPQIGEPTLVIK